MGDKKFRLPLYILLSSALMLSCGSASAEDLFSYCSSHRGYDPDPEELDRLAFSPDPAGTFAVEVHPSCNYSERSAENDIRAVVIHYTNGSASASWNWWQVRYPGTSAHYIIRRDGSLVQSVPERLAAHHLGCFQDRKNCLSCPADLCDEGGYFRDPDGTTIAVELENAGPLFEREEGLIDVFRNPIGSETEIYVYDGDDPGYRASRLYEAYTEAQLASLGRLIAGLEEKYEDLMVLGHSDINPSAVDPGPAFPGTKFFSEYPAGDRLPAGH